MGSVWRVRDHQDGTVKAAKLLRHSDAGSLLRFMREQSTRIHHTHVVTPLSWVGEDDTVLFTMPLVRGGSVATLVGDWGALPEIWVVTILDQVLSALDAVHDAGVVHRDVKSANLLLEPTGRDRPHVRLSDFGIAAAVDQPRLTSSATALGTPGYMPPEQRTGADPDPRQDLYSLATVGLEMLLGHPPPFTTDELPATSLSGLLVEARNPDPDRRPGTAAAFRDALHATLPDAATSPWDPVGVEVLDQFVTHEGAPVHVAPGRPTVVLERSHQEPEHEQREQDLPHAAPMLAVVGLAVLGIALMGLAALILLLG